jgi:uncharacterized membrane-anchored protein
MNQKLNNRVPEIVFSYWLIKMAATTLGETGADHFSKTLKLGYLTSSIIFLGFFVGLLIWKLNIKKYTPILYWSVFTSTSLAGTALCDFMDRNLGTGYALGSAILLSLLVFILFVWKRVEGTLSVENIQTSKSEVFYWVAFLISNTLGTAIGDYIADDLKFGFLGGALLIGSILLAIVVAYYISKVSKILLFWIAFILTRPFGATLGDFLTKTNPEGGLNLGTVGSSLFFILALILLIFREHQFYRNMKKNKSLSHFE